MKKRTIEISLETAKEWFKTEGDLKTLALQAFSEEELIPIVSYKDYDKRAYAVSSAGDIQESWGPSLNSYCSSCLAISARATSKLSKILSMTEGWIESPLHSSEYYYCIYYNKVKSKLEACTLTQSEFGSILAFKTRGQAEKFIKQHEGIIREYLRIK